MACTRRSGSRSASRRSAMPCTSSASRASSCRTSCSTRAPCSTPRSRAAVAKLTEADKLVPNLVDVKRQLEKAERLAKNPPPEPFPWALATLGVTLVSVGVYGGMWGKRWWKNRFRVVPTQVIGFIERGLNPALLDVRTKADFETSPLRIPGSIRLAPEEIDKAPMNVEPTQMI